MKFSFKKAEIGLFKTTEAAEALTGFDKNCRLMGLTRGAFSLIDLIHAVLQKTGTADVICVTWSAGIKDAHQIEWMQRDDLIRSFQIVTDRSYKTRQPKYAVSLTDLFGDENIRTTDIHAKFVLIKNENFNVVLRTSMNLNANKTCENFEIDEDREIFDFYYSFVNDVINLSPPGWDARRPEIERILKVVFGANFDKPEIKPGSLKMRNFRETDS